MTGGVPNVAMPVISREESKQAEDRKRPRSVVIFETIRREGETELARSSTSLLWSAIASGLSMAFSLVGTGVILAALPKDAPWAGLVDSFGYTFGFLIVILGRQQLFTENTLTPLLPLFGKFTSAGLFGVARLWAIVLAGNVLGAAAAAALIAYGGAFGEGPREAFAQLAATTVGPGTGVIFVKAVFAGWLIALMVWLLPLADQLTPVIIILLTWLVSAAQFEHIIAGSVEALFGAFSGATTWPDFVHFFVPTLLGNIVGGSAFVAAISSVEVIAEKTDADGEEA
jgi:formate-nitrite transporter family protein